MKSNNALVMDLTNVSNTFPQLNKPNIRRENMLLTLTEMLKSGTEIVLVEGPDGIGKTTLLANFIQEHSFCALNLFIRPSSRWAYDSTMLLRDLCDQINWLIYKTNNNNANTAIFSIEYLRNLIMLLQQKARRERSIYYFVIDGLNEIPAVDCHEQETILDFLPIGLPNFRFIFSGPLKCLTNRPLKSESIDTFRLSGFTLEETKEFFSHQSNIEMKTLGDIHKVCNMMPGRLASIKRLMQAGTDIKQFLIELPTKNPDFFEFEWNVVEKDDLLLRQILAILAYDQRMHSLESLRRICKTDIDTLEKKLKICNFIEQQNNGQEVEFVCDVFKRFAAEQLSYLNNEVSDLIISDLLTNPESVDALTYLPGFLKQAKRHDDLLSYLSPQNIGKLIEYGDSWIPLHQKTDMGVETALLLNRDGDLLRFGLQKATIASMEYSEPWRSEMEAYVALDDFPAAYALAQRMITKEDRLNLLLVIARAEKSKNLIINNALIEQIVQLYAQIDKKGIGERGLEIAANLLFTHPELAVELVQECIGQSESGNQIDLALAGLSFKSLIENEKTMGLEGAQQLLRAKIKNPKIQEFMNSISLIFGSYSAQEAITEVEKWVNAADRIFALRAWTTTNVKRADAAIVVEYALSTIIKTTTYAGNAKVFQEIALPIVFLTDLTMVKTLITRFDGLKGVIEVAGPTAEYVKLQTTLIEAEARYNKQAALDRLMDLFIYADIIPEHSTKLASLAIISRVLNKIDPQKEFELVCGIHSEFVKKLKTTVEEILLKTADHYQAVKPAIIALASTNTTEALWLIEQINTLPRRDAALLTFIEAIINEELTEANFDVISVAYNKISNKVVQSNASWVVFKKLTTEKMSLEPLSTKILAMLSWITNMTDAEEKCLALCAFIEIITEFKHKIPTSLIEAESNELQKTWDKIDVGWKKVDIGFIIVAKLAKCLPKVSAEFLLTTERTRNKDVLDCEGTALSYLGCVRLAIRCFGGLLKRKKYTEHDILTLNEQIERIPALSIRVLAWCELSLKFFVENDFMNCEKLIVEKVRPILETDIIEDQECYWTIIGSAAPALYCAHRLTALKLISQLPFPYRDNAYAGICNFLMKKMLPTESYDNSTIKNHKRIDYAIFLDVYELLLLFESDAITYSQIESLIDSIVKNFSKHFSKIQTADIMHKLNELIENKFPNIKYIKHEGFKILAEAQLARLRRNTDWDSLILRARLIPNYADRAFVLMSLGPIIINSSKAILILREAKQIIPQIATFDDRCDRFYNLAKLSVEIDKNMSKECLQLAWNETLPLEPSELPKARRRLIDFAYRLDPNFASVLAAETDVDSGRTYAREKTKQRIDTLKMREKIEQDEDFALKHKPTSEQQVELAKLMIERLNSNRINAIHISQTRSLVKMASQLKIQEAYIILSWVIENAVRRYSDTDQSNTILRSLFEAVKLSAELTFRIASRIRSKSDMGISVARSVIVNQKDLILTGERDKALDHLRHWASNATGFIKITDPFFGLDDLEFVNLIRSVNMQIPIFILTSRKHQNRIQLPWDETYTSHWRLAISDSDAGEVTISIIGKGSNDEHPIHDRWWLTEHSGLRIGTSTNSIGIGKTSEISDMDETDIIAKITEVNRYLFGPTREVGTEQLKRMTFSL